jgi:hypothetical protein
VPSRLDPVAHVVDPGGAKHAFRNRSPEPAVSIVVSTVRMGRFFREVAAALEPLPAIASRYGHWIATPEQNAAVGLRLPG